MQCTGIHWRGVCREVEAGMENGNGAKEREREEDRGEQK